LCDGSDLVRIGYVELDGIAKPANVNVAVIWPPPPESERR
jgi:hypothetical protein